MGHWADKGQCLLSKGWFFLLRSLFTGAKWTKKTGLKLATTGKIFINYFKSPF